MNIRELLIVSVNGVRRNDLRSLYSEVEIEEHVAAADVFRIRFPVSQRGNRTWTHLDDPDLAIWNRITIRAGYPHDHDDLIDGYITHVNVVLSGSGAEESYLELTGTDASVVMDLEDKQRAWPDKRDSDIAKQIFRSYNLPWEVEDTEYLHDNRVATIMQSESDIRFLQRLAARNNFECFVKGGRGFFRTANFTQPAQRKLTVPVGNAIALRFEVDGTPPTQLELRRIDPFSKTVEREALTTLPERQLASRRLDELRGRARVGSRVLRRQPTSANQEMRARLRAGYAAASGFVSLSGEIDGRSYGAVLRAKRLVTIDGVGPSHDGTYYVTRVRHSFYPDSYVQSFDARRNAVGLLGTEAVSSGKQPIAPGPAIPAGDNALPAQHTGSLSSGEL